MLCHQKIGSTFLAALLVLCLGWEVRAESISIIASDNALVGKNGPDGDKDEAQTLAVQSNGNNGNSRFAFLRFDVSPLAGGTITSASLEIYWISSQGDKTLNLVALKDLAVGPSGTTETSWDSHLTWNTRPDGTGNLPNANTSALLVQRSLPAADAPKLVSFDLSSKLTGLLASDTNNQLTLILYGLGGGDTNTFASLANTKGYAVPTLTVTGEGFNPIPEPPPAIPEPPSLASLGLALGVLLLYGCCKLCLRR